MSFFWGIMPYLDQTSTFTWGSMPVIQTQESGGSTEAVLGHQFTVDHATKTGILGHEFDVNITTESALGHEFTVALPDISILGHQFNIADIDTSSSLGHQFSTTITVSSTLGHQFSVGNIDDISELGHQFTVAINTLDVLGHQFTVSREVAGILGHQFTMQLTDVGVLGHKFSVPPPPQRLDIPLQTDLEKLNEDLAVEREEPEQLVVEPIAQQVAEEPVTEGQRIENALNDLQEWLVAASQMQQVLEQKLKNRRVTVDPATNPAVRDAIRRLFGKDSSTVTYEMYKQALEWRSKLIIEGRNDTYGTRD